MKKIDKVNLIIVIAMFVVSAGLLITGLVYYDNSENEEDSLVKQNITNIAEYEEILTQNLEEYKISGNFKVGEVINYSLSEWYLLYLNNEPFLYVEKEDLDKEVAYLEEVTRREIINDNGEVHLVIKCYNDSEYARIVASKESHEKLVKALALKKKGLIFSTIGFIIFFITIYRLIGFISKKPACECQIGPPLQ